MDTDAPDPLLVVLLGPTASGKTSLSLALAEKFHGEIISCDSVSVFRGVDIGSAKPTAQQRALVPHHMLDIALPSQHYTAGDYSRDARIAIRDIAARGKLPIITGGTGLYLRALLNGLFPGPERQPELRARLQDIVTKRGAAWLHRLLQRLDTAAAARIHANDSVKVIRAVEVSVTARQPMTTAWQRGRDPLTGFRILRIGLDPDRARLYQRIDQRAAAMFAHGLVAETRALISQHGRTAPVLSALGYKQARALLLGELSEPEAIRQTQQGHRNYAKRQMTWFRREPDVHWIKAFGDSPTTTAQAIELVLSGPLALSLIRAPLNK